MGIGTTLVKSLALYFNPLVSYNSYRKCLYFIFPILAVQIKFSVVATLKGSNSQSYGRVYLADHGSTDHGPRDMHAQLDFEHWEIFIP